MRTRSMTFTALLAAMVVVVHVGLASPAMSKPRATFKASGSIAVSVSAAGLGGVWDDRNITGNEFRNTCSIPASQGVDGYVVELSDAISAVTSTVLVSGSNAEGSGHDLDMYFFDAGCASTGASTHNSTTPQGRNDGSERGVFSAGTKYVLVTAGGHEFYHLGHGLEFTLVATQR